MQGFGCDEMLSLSYEYNIRLYELKPFLKHDLY